MRSRSTRQGLQRQQLGSGCCRAAVQGAPHSSSIPSWLTLGAVAAVHQAHQGRTTGDGVNQGRRQLEEGRRAGSRQLMDRAQILVQPLVSRAAWHTTNQGCRQPVTAFPRCEG